MICFVACFNPYHYMLYLSHRPGRVVGVTWGDGGYFLEVYKRLVGISAEVQKRLGKIFIRHLKGPFKISQTETEKGCSFLL